MCATFIIRQFRRYDNSESVNHQGNREGRPGYPYFNLHFERLQRPCCDLFFDGLVTLSPAQDRVTQRLEESRVLLVGFVKRPADLGKGQRIGEDQVAAFPGWLELLFEVKERLALAQIAETMGQKIDAGIQQ